MLYCCSSGSRSAQKATDATSSPDAISPSVYRKPTASSKSLPGVRRVTATLCGFWPGPAARISMGSSEASRSGRFTGEPFRTDRT
jgi:hypothetical protein